jgi:hypothetical protein
VLSVVGSIPWLLPGVAITAVVGWLVRDPLAETLAVSRLQAWLLVLAAGIVLAATLTPVEGPVARVGSCDLTRLGLAPFRGLRPVTEAGLNVALFVPLGAVLGSLSAGAPRGVLTFVAVAAPVAIEAIQSVVVALGRGCQSADVVDNLTGLVVGLAGVTATRHLESALRRPAR